MLNPQGGYLVYLRGKLVSDGMPGICYIQTREGFGRATTFYTHYTLHTWHKLHTHIHTLHKLHTQNTQNTTHTTQTTHTTLYTLHTLRIYIIKQGTTSIL